MLFKSAALSLLLVATTSADTHFLRSLADDTNVNEAAKDHFILNPIFEDTLEVAKFIVNLNKMGFTDETRLNAGGQCDCCGCGPMDCSQCTDKRIVMCCTGAGGVADEGPARADDVVVG
ncbi:hypothetical protein TrLO_g15647 [Triparma laevis f. longispina]|uniref:Uncharacterized protein n=1 Tax=Triparma laevis f. longispina TaxID=1714387 RepID=A0A9W7B5Z5_9STRA|nr:hypothetical protein TrLO_g15647 [Triparma laevis f. longispina]